MSGFRDLWQEQNSNAQIMKTRKPQKEVIKIEFKSLKIKCANPTWKGIVLVTIILTFLLLWMKL